VPADSLLCAAADIPAPKIVSISGGDLLGIDDRTVSCRASPATAALRRVHTGAGCSP